MDMDLDELAPELVQQMQQHVFGGVLRAIPQVVARRRRLIVLVLNLMGLVIATQEARRDPRYIPRGPWVVPPGQFDLFALDEVTCWYRFRLLRPHILLLARELGIPNTMRCSNGSVFFGLEGLCLTLCRLAYPQRLWNNHEWFHRSYDQCSRIIHRVIDWVLEQYDHLLHFDPNRLTPRKLSEYACAIFDKGCPIECLFGFLDGNFQHTRAPQHYRQWFYSGHTRSHGLRYHAIICPDGLIPHMHGPLSGSNNDLGVLADSDLAQIIYTWCRSAIHGLYRLYSDAGYNMRPYLIVPHSGVLDANQQWFNNTMTSMRVSVEWSFHIVSAWFAFLRFPPQQIIGLVPVGSFYRFAVLLTNCVTCLRGGNEVSDYFGLPPPTLHEYLHS